MQSYSRLVEEHTCTAGEKCIILSFGLIADELSHIDQDAHMLSIQACMPLMGSTNDIQLSLLSTNALERNIDMMTGSMPAIDT